jgi:hypothetical protein
MIRRLQITALAIALVGSSASLHAAPDAGPDFAEIAADAGAASVADDAGSSNDELLAQLKALKESYDELRLRQEAGSSIKPAVIGLLLSATWIMLGVVRRMRKEQWTDWGKAWIPWVAVGLGVAVAFLERYALGGTWTSALVYGAGPALAPVIHELTKLFTKREKATT